MTAEKRKTAKGKKRWKEWEEENEAWGLLVDMIRASDRENDELLEREGNKSAASYFDEIEEFTRVEISVEEIHPAKVQPDQPPWPEVYRESLRRIRISRELFRIEQRAFPRIFTEDSQHDVNLWAELRDMLGWEKWGWETEEITNYSAIERRTRIAREARDGEWLTEFGKLVDQGTDRPAIVRRSTLVVVKRWELQGDGAPPTKAKLKRACMKRWPEEFPESKGEWVKIHRMAGTDTLRQGR